MGEMQLGERSRSPMRRTTSLTEFSAEDVAEVAAIDAEMSTSQIIQRHRHKERPGMPPRMHRRSFNDLAEGAAAESAQFLLICGLCNRSLGAGLDTFIYRGELAFCSMECREKKMNQNDLKEKRLLTPMKSKVSPSTAVSEASSVLAKQLPSHKLASVA